MTRSVAGVSGLRIKALLAVSTIAAAFAFAGAVSAADIAVEPEPEVVSDWTGFYLGAHFGVAGGDFEYPFSWDNGEDFVDGEFELDSSGLFAGGQIGFNWQMNSLVLGIEADASWTNLEGDFEANADTSFIGGASASLEAGSELNWFGTIRGRLGFLLTPGFMLYGTGGAAFGKVESGYDISAEWGQCCGGPNLHFEDSTSDTQWGWTAGAGAEYKITDNWTFKAEYLYIDLGDQNLFSDDIFGGDLEIDVDTKFHTLKAGVNFLF
ncbi:MAG TPA: outer membrane protein [Aestuariivirgaceae bacterium]|nr:outer membrane protein [Aestuariivirgaceae bacterium]